MKKYRNKNSELRADFLKLMAEHPDLPVIAMTDSDVVCDDWCGYWLSSIGTCGITRIASWEKPDETEMFFDEMDDAVENMMDYYADDVTMVALSQDEFEAFIRVKAEKLDWREVIYVKIVPFDRDDIR